jgi:hypothetical protein
MSKILKTIALDNFEELQENYVVKWNCFGEEYFKIINITDSKIFGVPFKEIKERVFKNVTERKKIYENIKIVISKTKLKKYPIDVYGKHLSNLEKKQEEKVERKEKRELKEEIKEEAQHDRDDRSYIETKFDELKKELQEFIHSSVDSAVSMLKTEGKDYGCKYIPMTFDEVAKIGVKSLGERNLKYVFELNGKLIFMGEKKKK